MARKVICHQISAGNNFDNTVPTGPPTNTLPPNVPFERDDFPAQAGGGRFEIGGNGVQLLHFKIHPDVGTTWTLKVLDNADALVQEIARNEEDDEGNPVGSSLPIGITCRVNVWDQYKVVLETAGATGAISSEIMYEDGL
jgi:hypothetical protein